VFYRFCRAVDDIADDASLPAAGKRELLAAWGKAVEAGLPEDLERVIAEEALDRRWLAAIVEGCAADIEPQTFADLDALRQYCWKVACAVGLCSVRIFGCRMADSAPYAEHLGYALQFTNILRDVGEDARAGRVYLPETLLREHGSSAQAILAGSNSFVGASRALAQVARAEYRAAIPPREDRRALLPAEVMRGIYLHLLHQIEAHGFDVRMARQRVPLGTKMLIAARTAFCLPLGCGPSR
jgi:phytoene synthase